MNQFVTKCNVLDQGCTLGLDAFFERLGLASIPSLQGLGLEALNVSVSSQSRHRTSHLHK